MSAARDEVLARIRAAISAPTQAHLPVPREYRTSTTLGADEAIELFVDRLVDYKATVHRTDSAGLSSTLSSVLNSDKSVVIPPGIPAQWRTACTDGVRLVLVDGDPAPLTAGQLDEVGAVVTACRVAIAETGTIVLDAAPDQGRRILTLVPDHHVVVVFAEQVVASVPESLIRLEPTRPLTFISGPSATSDIEFKRVEGVHGPRVLDVIVVS
ncbi:MAG TPA: LUD domain-containing protein [Acidothermaceae bacterium]|jgi:L-lactate dehydrogenase complex protein LldG|nr:LUD domain-containing protein [Acidothermaceae bacterium]